MNYTPREVRSVRTKRLAPVYVDGMWDAYSEERMPRLAVEPPVRVAAVLGEPVFAEREEPRRVD